MTVAPFKATVTEAPDLCLISTDFILGGMKNDKKEIEEFKKKIDEHIKDETINNKSNIELYYVGDKSLPNLVINN